MEEYKNISKELQRMLDKAEELDWSYSVYVEPSQNNRTYAEMEKYSPAGEDFLMIIDFDAEDQAESFLKDLWDYADNFDVDGHVEMWLPERGKGGCPSTARELVEDAEAIVEMIKELYGQLDGVLHPELSDDSQKGAMRFIMRSTKCVRSWLVMKSWNGICTTSERLQSWPQI